MNKFFILLFILFSYFNTNAQQAVSINGEKDVIYFEKNIQYYEDKSRTLNIEQIKADSFQSKFKLFPTEILNLGASSSAVWLKIDIVYNTTNRYYFEIDNPSIDSVFFYYSDSLGNYQSYLTGKNFPLTTKEIHSTHTISEVPCLSYTQKQSIYLRLTSSRYTYIEMKFVKRTFLFNTMLNKYGIELAYIGVMFVAVVYNLFIFIFTKNVAYLYYVIYVSIMGVNILNSRGYLHLFFYEHKDFINTYSYVPGVLYIPFITIFSIYFLKVKQYSKQFYYFLLLVLFFSILNTFFNFLGYNNFIFRSSITFLYINISIYFILGAFIYYKGYKPAIYYLISWIIFAFFTIWAILTYTAILPMYSFSKYLTSIGFSLETIIIFLGLINSINVLKKENIELIKNQKVILEEEVKRQISKVKAQNDKLHQQKEELAISNEYLEEKNQEIETQNEELYLQKEELEKINKELKCRDEKISEQNAELANKQIKMITQNEKLFRQKQQIEALKNNLEEIISQRTIELKQTLDNVTKQNQDLSQFSYIISHNLRAPVARILGLMNIFNEKDYNDDFNKNIFAHLRKTTTDLDTVITDLTQIISIRKDLNKTKEEIDILKVIEQEKSVFEDEIKRSNISINIKLVSIKSFHSIKSYFQSILYNLLSNAIKYKSNKRSLIVTIKVEQVNDFVCLSVQDNGLGIDLSKTDTYKIFGLYQRMHDHVEGKGLGLFLVKTQIESLGGKIEIESELDVGSIFKVYFPI